MRTRSFIYDDHRFVVSRGVFDPVRHLSGIAFADQLGDAVGQLAPHAQTALDLGTGSGVLAATLARLGLSVVATDISDAAVTCATQNCSGLDVDARQGDMFEPVEGDQFDLAIVNPPYERSNSTWRRSSSFTSPDFLEKVGARIHAFAPLVVLGFPVDGEATLAATGLQLTRWRTVATKGHDLGLYVSTANGRFESE